MADKILNDKQLAEIPDEQRDAVRKLNVSDITRTRSIFNYEQIVKLYGKTPPKYIKERKGKGGQIFKYVDTGYIRQCLDSVFGFDWSFEIRTNLVEAYEVAKTTGTCVVLGTLTCNTTDDGGNHHTLIKEQYGRKEVAFKNDYEDGKKVKTSQPLDFGNDMKAAASDALKKCASQFGIARDVYAPEDFVEYEIIEDNSQRIEEIKDAIAKANMLSEVAAVIDKLTADELTEVRAFADERIDAINKDMRKFSKSTKAKSVKQAQVIDKTNAVNDNESQAVKNDKS